MQRRKFLIGAASIAAGSGAALGTGAFTSVTADREVSVNVTGDGSAYLGLSPADSANGVYADGGDSSTELSVNFDDISTEGEEGSALANHGGNGVNPDAVTDVDGVFTIKNQGTQSVDVSLDGSSLTSGVTAALATGNSTETLSVGDSVDVDFEIDSSDYDPDGSGTLTITATA